MFRKIQENMHETAPPNAIIEIAQENCTDDTWKSNSSFNIFGLAGDDHPSNIPNIIDPPLAIQFTH